ncbi:hypothetical protein [Zhenpiania hominis]|uniref:hypothetical protein n=1 Tax=Zhenpiania hominis TaxID=2763644 RepID=UPI0039F5D0A9
MGDGIIAKFIYFWIFLIGGLFMARILGIADTASNMAVLSISMAFIYVGWNLLRAKGKKRAAQREAEKQAAMKNSRQKPNHNHKKKKR